MVFDRILGKRIDNNDLPSLIELGRYAVCPDELTDLTTRNFKVKEGQRIQQELLDPVNKDKHDVFEKIAQQVTAGNFTAIPLLQGIKTGLHFGDFENELEEKLHHIEAIFHAPYSKLTRAIEKVPVSRAKRISNKSNQYLAAHTEDWLHKSLVSFHPSRILTEEIVLNEDVYENQLLIAFVSRAAHYLERRLSHTMDISHFLQDYNVLMEKFINESGWFKRVRRELDLAGKVYDESGNNYQKGTSDMDIVGATYRRLQKLRDSLLRLRQFDLYYEVDQRKVNSIQYHDTNVLVNHQHYRYLKSLWLELMKKEQQASEDVHSKSDTYIIDNIRKYGLALINYVIVNNEYLGYSVDGSDSQWIGKRKDSPIISLEYDKNGIINLQIGEETIRFVVMCSVPSADTHIPTGTYIIAYNNSDMPINNYGPQIIPVSLKDVESAERIAYIIRGFMLKQYVDKLHSSYAFPSVLSLFQNEIEHYIGCIQVDSISFTYKFFKYPNLDVDKFKIVKLVSLNSNFKNKGRYEQKDIIDKLEHFIDEYASRALELAVHLKCFDLQCKLPYSEREVDNLNYLKCSCGAIIDSTNLSRVIYYNDKSYSKEEMGMDYIEFDYNSFYQSNN